MKTQKFSKYDHAFIVLFDSYSADIRGKRLTAIEVRIIDVKGSEITGQTLEKYGYLKQFHPRDLSKIVTKKRKSKGKEVDFSDDELVAVHRKYKENQLLTDGEAKLKMVDYIMHDFQDEVERDYGHEEY